MKKLIVLALIPLLLTGCVGRRREPLVRVVERIEVICRYQDETILRTYTQSRKMTAVLNYLRWVNPRGKADIDPEIIIGDTYKITVYLSDGEQTVYHQKTNGYFREEGGRWEKIKPERGENLQAILAEMESDE